MIEILNDWAMPVLTLTVTLVMVVAVWRAPIKAAEVSHALFESSTDMERKRDTFRKIVAQTREERINGNFDGLLNLVAADFADTPEVLAARTGYLQQRLQATAIEKIRYKGLLYEIVKVLKYDALLEQWNPNVDSLP